MTALRTPLADLLLEMLQDYEGWLQVKNEGHLVSSQYIKAAMDGYRGQFRSSTSEVLFVMASDDIGWCHEMFANNTDVVFASTAAEKLSVQQPTFDLAVLSMCNHSILRFAAMSQLCDDWA